VGTIEKLQAVIHAPRCRAATALPAAAAARTECLEQLLEAFADIADRDDIHQAAERLAWVQEWIKREADRAAADPIFDAVRLAS
jgi:ABC-type phosphate/phosphonate transport system substrate-binding protein